MKFLGALHSLGHNDETHLERRTFLCTHFFYSLLAYWENLRCWRPSSHLGDGLSSIYSISPLERADSARPVLLRWRKVWNAISVFSGWLSRRLKFRRSFKFWARKLSLPGEESCICDLFYMKECFVGLISVLGVKHLQYYHIIYCTHTV